MDPNPHPLASGEATVPKFTAALGLVLTLSSALPWAPDGRSFLAMLAEEFIRGPLEGFLMLIGFGSPFLFGLTVTLGALWIGPRIGRRVIRVPIACMHSQLLLVALVVWLGGNAVATPALLGFAVVSGVGLALHSARTSAEGDGPTFGWYVRWGAMVIAGIASWAELQRTAGLELGWGLHVALAAVLLMLVALSGRNFRSAAPMAGAE